jgi:hypothetical protein
MALRLVYGRIFCTGICYRVITWKEIITIGQGVLKVEKKGALLVKPKEYDLRAVKKIRVQEDIGSGFGGYGAFGGQRRNGLAGYMGGTIRFDYGMQTVKFAGGIDEAEARYILTQLSERHLLSEENYE